MAVLEKKTIEEIEVTGKRVLVRFDFNVKLTDGKVTYDRRLREAIPTINYLTGKGARLILCSHLGRPHGYCPELSLAPVAEQLSVLLGKHVGFIHDIVGEEAKKAALSMENGDIILLENLRFDEREKLNDAGFAKELASLAEIFVQDALGSVHNRDASVVSVAQFLPSALGFHTIKEAEAVHRLLDEPARPFVAVIGGSKVSDKFCLLERLIDKCDTVIIGGGMAYSFFRALGHRVGDSITEPQCIERVRALLEAAKQKNTDILIPVDNIIARYYSPDSPCMSIYSDSIPDGWMGMDIGPRTRMLFSRTILGAGTVFWNGPMGVAEWEKFKEGTESIAKAIEESGAVSIVGGDDSLEAVDRLGYAKVMTHLSTGGSATLRYLAGGEMPGIDCIENKEN